MLKRSLRVAPGLAAVLLMGAGLTAAAAPAAAVVCGSVGGRHVDVTGCADPFYELNALPPPPPPPPPPGVPPPPPPPPPVYVPPPPPIYPDVSVCGGVGRRIYVSGCV